MMVIWHSIATALAIGVSFQVDGVQALIGEREETQRLCKKKTLRTSIQISIVEQKLRLYQDHQISRTYLISTSKKGVGELLGSFKTPRGLHCISAKIGGGAPLYTVFKARIDQGFCWSKNSGDKGDFILSRILVLEGLENGLNRGTDALNRCVDTQQRHIYIHGTHQENEIGLPSSHGCIRMKNCDIAELYILVPLGAHVSIR